MFGNNQEPSLLSKSNPIRLDFRAGMMVLASPLMIGFGLYQSLYGNGAAAERGPIALVFGVIFAIVGGVWLASRYVAEE